MDWGEPARETNQEDSDSGGNSGSERTMNPEVKRNWTVSTQTKKLLVVVHSVACIAST